MTRVVCTQHGPTCDRIHVGHVVRVVVPQFGYMQYGTVTAINDGLYTVTFPDGIEGFDGDFLSYREDELEKVSV
jgi:hypothetical protein